jgi:hypothetical protein
MVVSVLVCNVFFMNKLDLELARRPRLRPQSPHVAVPDKNRTPARAFPPATPTSEPRLRGHAGRFRSLRAEKLLPSVCSSAEAPQRQFRQCKLRTWEGSKHAATHLFQHLNLASAG